jgi:subtilisin-like proprotein convertase family protein
MQRTLASVALLVVCTSMVSAQMVWDYAASFAYPGYLAVPTSPALQFSGSISVDCWVNAPDISSSGDQTLLCKYSTPGTGFALTLRTGHILFEIGGSPVFYGRLVVPDGQWTHVAVVYDSSAHTLASYINGNLDTMLANVTTPIRWNQDSLFIGFHTNNPPVTQFTGLLDEIRVWNRPLTQAEVQCNRFVSLAYVSGPYAGLVLSITFQYLAQAPVPYAPMDFSGNDLTVAVRGKVTGTRIGSGPSRKLIPNESVRFDGGGYLSTPSSTANNFSASHTLQCWIWPDTIQTGIILQKREGFNLVGYTLYLSENRVAFRINNPTVVESRKAIPSREWTHIAAVFNDTTMTVSLYLNGSLDTTASPPVLSHPIASGDSVFIGTGYNGRFRGYLDNVVLSPGVWTQKQIASWMATGLDLWNKTSGLPSSSVYTFDGSLVSVFVSDLRMRFNGTARFSHPAYFSRVPTSPMLRADDIGYPFGFTLKASDRRIPATETRGDMLEDSLSVSEEKTISSLRLALTLGHTMTTDLVVSLVSPAGDSVEVFNRYQLLHPLENINAIFDDWADSSLVYDKSMGWLPRVRPSNSLNAAFAGRSSKGIWKLHVNDVSGGDVGRLYVWGLQFNNTTATGIALNSEEVTPGKFSLVQNYPNPFNPTTKIGFGVSGLGSRVKIAVYDLLGREVAVLMDERKEAGRYEVKWDASRCASGVYVCRMTAGDFVESKKMILMK